MIVPIRFRVEITRPDPWDPHVVETVERYAGDVLAAAALYLEDRLALEQRLDVDVRVVAETGGLEVIVRGRDVGAAPV